MEELSFGCVSAEGEGSRKVFACNLGPATLQLKFAKGRVIERIFRKALRVSHHSQLRQARPRSIALPNCDRTI